jgi:hypothetical protein
MDIITTGQTKTSVQRLKMVCDFIKNIQKDYKEKVNTNGLKYGNLLDFINTKAKLGEFGDKDTVILETEFRDALRNLEEDNVISIYGNTRSPLIRFTGGTD